MAKQQTRRPTAAKVRMTVVTQSGGAIVGGMLPGKGSERGARIEFLPLPDQAVHEVEVAASLVQGKSPDELCRTLSLYRVEPTGSRLVPLHATPRRGATSPKKRPRRR